MKIFTVDKGTLAPTEEEKKMKNPTEIISPVPAAPVVILETRKGKSTSRAMGQLILCLLIGLLLAAAITMAIYHAKMARFRRHHYYHGHHWPESAPYHGHGHGPPRPPMKPPTTENPKVSQANAVVDKLNFLRQLLNKIREREQTLVDKNGMPLDGQMKFTMISVHPIDNNQGPQPMDQLPFLGIEPRQNFPEDNIPIQIHPPMQFGRPPHFPGMRMGPPPFQGPPMFGPEPFPRIFPPPFETIDEQQPEQPTPVFRVTHHFQEGTFNPAMVQTEVFKGKQFAKLAEKLFGAQNNGDAFGIPPPMGFPPPPQVPQGQYSWEVDANAPPLPPEVVQQMQMQQQQLFQQQQQAQLPIVPAQVYTRGEPVINNVEPSVRPEQFPVPPPVFGPNYNSNQQFVPAANQQQPEPEPVIEQPFMQQQPFFQLPQEAYQQPQQQTELVPPPLPRLQEIPPPPPMRREEPTRVEEVAPNRMVKTDGSWEEVVQYQDPQIDDPHPMMPEQEPIGLGAILRPDVMLNVPQQPRGPPAPVNNEGPELSRGEGAWIED